MQLTQNTRFARKQVIAVLDSSPSSLLAVYFPSETQVGHESYIPNPRNSGKFFTNDTSHTAEELASLKADPELAFAGRALLSAEADADHPLVFDWLVADSPAAFFQLIRPLPPRERDVMIGYLILRADQKRLAHVLGFAQQSEMSALLRRAKSRLAGAKLSRTKPPSREAETIVSPSHLGEFRIPLQFVDDFCAASSAVRSGESADYGSDRF